MSLVYIFSKFTEEALTLELFLMSLLCFCLFGYFLFKRRRYGVAKEQIPDQVVRAFLTELLGVSESFRLQLFGEQFQAVNMQGMAGQISNHLTNVGAGASPNPQLQQQISALQKDLHHASENQSNLNKQVTQFRTEKESLETKLKEALANAAANAGTAGAPIDSAELDELKKKASNLEARLAEYEVIEDDLANLKKFQQENAALRAELNKLKSGSPSIEASEPVTAAVAPPAPTPAPAKVVAAAPAKPASTPMEIVTSEDFDAIAQEVQDSITADASPAQAPAGASAADPNALAAAQTAAETSDAAPAAEVAAAAEPSNDNDLLSEFEKMLSS